MLEDEPLRLQRDRQGRRRVPTRDGCRPCNPRAAATSAGGFCSASGGYSDPSCVVPYFSASDYSTLRERRADTWGESTFNSGRPNCSWSNRRRLAMLAANCCASGQIGLHWSNSLNTACTRRVISWPYRLSLVWRNWAYKVGNGSRHQSTVCLPSLGIAAARTSSPSAPKWASRASAILCLRRFTTKQ